MPFSSEQVLSSLLEASREGRLAHAYLFTGADAKSLEALAFKVAEALLGKSPVGHPDFHVVRPESKSRRIRIEQMRELEKNLRLKAYMGGYKSAVICESERMCWGGADAANAFLKTLEEPPAGTVILLTSSEPQMILPTILSRCVRVMVHDENQVVQEAGLWNELLAGWFAGEISGPLRAYRRAALLSQTWQSIRERTEEKVEAATRKTEEKDEDLAKAAIEAEVLLGRKQSIVSLQSAYWEQERKLILEGSNCGKAILCTIRLLEELNQSLMQNVDQSLAVERTCLLIEDAMVEGM